jgi:hypothetical protein
LDATVTQKSNAIAETFIKNESNDTMLLLVQIPDNFTDVINILATGLRAGSPLERLEHIYNSFVMLKDLYHFEDGEQPSDTDLTKLFEYALNQAKVPDVVSLMKYLQTFLLLDNPHVTLLLPKEKMIARLFIRAVEDVRTRAGV